MNLEKIGQNAKTAEPILRNLATSKKNEVLAACADALIQDADAILETNELDMQRGREKQYASAAAGSSEIDERQN